MIRTWPNVIVTASIAACGAALAFFVAANVNAAVLASGDLSFWGFVFYLAGAGGVVMFMLCFGAAVVADLLVGRLPTSVSYNAQSWMGGAFVAAAAIAASFLMLTVLRGFWPVWPTLAATAIASGLSFVPARRVGRPGGRREQGLGLASTPPF